MALTPLLDSFKRGEVAHDARLLAARGELAPRAAEQLAILSLLVADQDDQIREAAEGTLLNIPLESIQAVLAASDVPTGLREFFAARGVEPSAGATVDFDAPLIDTSAPDEMTDTPDAAAKGTPKEMADSMTQQLAKMNFPQRLKAAMKGSREMRAMLIRDPNKLIASAVLASPKLTENEVEGFCRLAQLSEDVLRVIASNRAWIKNYSVVLGLTKNPKTPLAMSLNLMSRLLDKDLQMLSVDRNVPEPLRIAARKRLQGIAR
jgi:hypothetical protein